MSDIIGKAQRMLQHEWRSARSRYLDPFVFIHINKNGGSSIEHALNLRFEHLTVVEKRWELGAYLWEMKFKFAFVRNPWDRVVSQYAYRKKTEQRGFRDGTMSFEEWLDAAYVERRQHVINDVKMFMDQTSWIYNQNQLQVDFVGRFERLNEDFQKICEKIGRKATLPHAKKSDRGDYRDYYTPKTRQIVADFFARDIDNFEYSF